MSTKWFVALSCATLMAACGQTPTANPKKQDPVLDPLTLPTAPAATSVGTPVAPPAAEPSLLKVDDRSVIRFDTRMVAYRTGRS